MIALIQHAVSSGVTLLDTSDIYGPFTNELLLGKALKGGVGEKVELASKFGIDYVDGKREARGDKAGLAKLIGLARETNVQGEEQKKLDVLSNEVFMKALVNSGRIVARCLCVDFFVFMDGKLIVDDAVYSCIGG